MTEHVVQLANVSKSFRGVSLLTDLNFTLLPGKSYGLVGPNGSGKSVLLRLMAGLTPPSSGTVTIHPRFLDARRIFPDRFGLFIDGPTFLGGLSGIENLRELARIRRRASEAELRALMEQLQLDPDDTAPARRYSLGMKQKLGLCQALMEHPEVLFLDEPYNALDTQSVAIVDGIFANLRAAGKTVVMTSHHATELERNVEQFIRIDNHTATLSDEPNSQGR